MQELFAIPPTRSFGADWATRWSSSTGAISCNNIEVYMNRILNTGRRGLDLAAGDSLCAYNQIGFTGSDGIRALGFGNVSNNGIWNVFGHGMVVDQVADIHACDNRIYDGVRSGIVAGGALLGGKIANNTILRNGVGALLPAEPGYVGEPDPIDSSGIYVITDSPSLNLHGNQCDNLYSSNVKRQRYGIYFLNAATRARMDGASAVGNVTANWRVAAPSNIQWHDSVAASMGFHPGFQAQGSINFDGFNVDSLGGLTGRSEQKTISVGVLACGLDSFIEITTAGVMDVTDVTTTAPAGNSLLLFIYNGTADTKTFKHNTATLRSRGGVDRALPQYGILVLLRRSDNVFVEVGM